MESLKPLNYTASAAQRSHAFVRRVLFFGLTLALTTFATGLMLSILEANGLSVLKVAALVLFAVLFTWISGAFWTAIAGGILLKGPLILMFVVLTIGTLAILDRSAAWLWRLRPIWGLMWMLVLVLPWFVAIFWRAGEAFFSDSLGGDMLSKLSAQESHGAPPGVYLLLFWVTFWPGAPLAGMAMPAVWRARSVA